MDSRNLPFLSRSGNQESNALLLYISGKQGRERQVRDGRHLPGPAQQGFQSTQKIFVNTFEFYRFRFHFRALDEVQFPPSKSGNVVRGAFGMVLRDTASPATYQRLFQPVAPPGQHVPSGLVDWPRPFVLRATHLDGHTFTPGDQFHFDVHIFELRQPFLGDFRSAFTELAEKGIGVRRGRAALDRVEQLDLSDSPIPDSDAPQPSQVTLDRPEESVRAVQLRFLSATELKTAGGLADRPEFPILLGRLRDRLSTLRSLYGPGPLEIDFRAIGERARTVRMVRCELTWERVERKSGRTGQVHPLGGFLGEADYEGDLAEFMPWLRVARWVGVGRQTVWGKGDVRVVGTSPGSVIR